MRIIKLNAIDSTNSFLRQLSLEQSIEDFTVAVAEHQTSGRGQMGSKWYSERGKNLMFSVFKDISGLSVDSHFYISMAVSLAIIDALKTLNIIGLKIKWPNDILSEQRKLCGILIENVIKQNQIKSSIIGVGINVNQEDFNNLPKATSMRNVSDMTYDKDEVLQAVLEQFDYYFSLLSSKSFNNLKERYESEMFRIHKPSTFKDRYQNVFTGYIKGVTNSGNLNVLVENNEHKYFDLKEVELMY